MAIEKYPGDKWGGIIRLTYRGPGNVVWVGAGLRVDPYDYWNIPSYWWAAIIAELPPCPEETVLEYRVEDIFPDDVPSGELIDTFKVMAWEDPTKIGSKEAVDALIIDKDRDDEVYTVAPVSIDWVKIVSVKPYKVEV